MAEVVSAATIKPPVALDAVLTVHGWPGIRRDEHVWAKYVNGLGYLVVLPASLGL